LEGRTWRAGCRASDEGIDIMENLNLDEIARPRRPRLIFVALPLRLVGSTGSPIRPIAIASASFS
jgi:kynurenine formamidase